MRNFGAQSNMNQMSAMAKNMGFDQVVDMLLMQQQQMMAMLGMATSPSLPSAGVKGANLAIPAPFAR